MTLSEAIDALQVLGCRPQRRGDRWIARCPAHDDKAPSLSLRDGNDGTLLAHCFAGCSFAEVLEALRR